MKRLAILLLLGACDVPVEPPHLARPVAMGDVPSIDGMIKEPPLDTFMVTPVTGVTYQIYRTEEEGRAARWERRILEERP